MKKIHRKAILFFMAVSVTVSIAGCGKKKNEISDYGTEAVASQEDADSEEVKANEFGSLSDKLETDNINWQESINVNGINYKIDLMYDIPEQENVPVYLTMSISDFDKKEKEIVEKLFGDDYVEVHEILNEKKYNKIPETEEMTNVILDHWYTESELKGEKGSNANKNYDEIYEKFGKYAEFHNSWGYVGDFSLHTYKGKYNGNEYYAIFSRYEDKNFMFFELFSISIKDIMGDSRLGGYTYTSNITKEEDNEAYAQKEKLMDDARNLIDDILGGEYYDINSTKNLMFFGEDEAYSSIFDGYRFELKNNKVDSSVYEGTIYEYGYNSERVEISNEGIISICLGIFYDSMEMKSQDTNILSFENIKESVRDIIENEIDVNMVQGSNYINIDKIELKYYPIVNPENDMEFTILPVWFFYSNTKSFRLLVNAVDGSMVFIKY